MQFNSQLTFSACLSLIVRTVPTNTLNTAFPSIVQWRNLEQPHFTSIIWSVSQGIVGVIRFATYFNPLAHNDIYIYMSYRTANLQTLHFKYLLNKYTYWIF